VNSREYRDLLVGLSRKRLMAAGYADTDIRSYLSEERLHPEVPDEDIEGVLLSMWQAGRRRSGGDTPTNEFKQTYKIAATYRALNAAHKRKSYLGFEQYALLSSGVISSFIELSKYAFYFALADELPLKSTQKIPSYLQTEAAYRVSQRLLGTIDSNVPAVGPDLTRLVTALGSLLRSRLLRHASEPEANRLFIDDFPLLDKPEFTQLEAVLKAGVIWSVLHVQGEVAAFRPRNPSRPPSVEIIINRILSPALGISPRSRWRVTMHLGDLADLITPERRVAAHARLLSSVGSADGTAPTPLFDAMETIDAGVPETGD
jgi:hypothetical protein